MTLEEFNRSYTEEELRERLIRENLNPQLWEYCVESYRDYHAYLVEDFGWLDEGETLDQHVSSLKENDGWVADTTREEAWIEAMTEPEMNAYLSQRDNGNSHKWAMIYADEIRNGSENPIVGTYLHFIDKDKTFANREKEIFIDSIPESKNTIFKKAMIQSFGQGKTIDEDVDFARGVAYQYDQLLKSGCTSPEIYHYAEDLAEDRYEIYYRAYRTALDNGATSKVAYSFADKIEELQVNGYLIIETRSFSKEFKEIWQREFYYTLIMEDVNQNGECWGVLDRNLLRAQLELPHLDEPLTVNDREYLRIKQDLMANGQNEISADREAYEIVYGSQSDSHKTRPIFESEQLKQDIGHILFPNEEDYQDYLDGEI